MGDTLINPGRGFFRVYPFTLGTGNPFDENLLAMSLDDAISLALVELSLERYRLRALDETAAREIDAILDFFARHKKDVILRVSYDFAGRAAEKEPSRLARILEHIKETGNIVADHRDTVLLMQGLFIGNWGEMHGSRFAEENTLTALYTAFRESKMSDLPLAVRTPKMMRLLQTIHTGEEPSYNLAFFDDAILADETDLGTFASGERESELSFLTTACENVLNGGETVLGNGQYSADETVSFFRQAHIGYLNCQHDEKMLQKWKETPYKNTSLYDYIGQHLGYRLQLQSCTYDKQKQELRAEIRNTGFGALTEETECEIVSSPTFSETITWQIFLAGETKSVVCKVPNGVGRATIRLRRKKDGRQMQFANDRPREFTL